MSFILTDENFEKEVLQSENPVLVDFWAPWCGPCQMMSPIIDELSKELEGRFKVAKLNVDENPQMAQKYEIMSIPSLKIFKKGEVVKDLVGMQAKETLKNELESAA